MILTTGFDVPGRPVRRVLGIARGNTIRTRHLGRHLLARFRSLVGGEMIDYTKVLAEAREQALDRLVEHARAMGANAVIGLRFASVEVLRNAAELLAYGTAVVVEDADSGTVREDA